MLRLSRPWRHASPLVAGMAAVIGLLVATQAPASAAIPVGPPTQSGGVDGQVYTTLVVGDTVYAGGSFTQAVTRAGTVTTRTNLAAFSLSTGAVLGSWQANVNGAVKSLASSGNYLYVGGGYTRIGGVAQGRLARVSLSTGAVDTGFRPQLNSQVRAVQVGADGVFAGGQFTVSGNTSQSYLAKFNATSGAKITAFAPTASGPVNALALSPDGTRLAVGGAFATLSGATRRGMGLVDPTTGSIVGPSFASSVNPMLTLDWSDDGTALFGGSGNFNNLAARWNPTTGARGWNFTTGGDVQAINYFDGDVYVGFHDNFQNNTHTKLLAVNAQSGAISTSFRPTFNRFWGVRAISAGPWGLVIGGQFTNVSGTWAYNWARWPAA
jgi:WD40 repeat protein